MPVGAIALLVLYPKMKMNYFTRYWDEKLHSEVRRSAEAVVSNLFNVFYGMAFYIVTTSLRNAMKPLMVSWVPLVLRRSPRVRVQDSVRSSTSLSRAMKTKHPTMLRDHLQR